MWRLIRFALVGGLGFLVDAGILVSVLALTGLDLYSARLVSFAAAATTTWWLNRCWTFADRAHGPATAQWPAYMGGVASGAVLNYGVYVWLVAVVEAVAMQPVWGVAAGSIAGLAVNFTVANFLIFRAGKGLQPSAAGDSLTGAAVLVPLACGILSLMYGQDSNWDLRNYHLYNPYGWFNDRLQVDLAPAGMQSYFNPLIDAPYFMLVQTLPAPLVGFLFGLVHGLAFVLVLLIARRLLASSDATARTVIGLSLAGLTAPVFLSQLGNTMGDNLTALFVLAALAGIMIGWRRLERLDADSVALSLGAGVVLGLGVGLKLTNAVYAAALCLALLTAVPGSWRLRLGHGLLTGTGVVGGALATGGYWHLGLWQEFGNPLFPQFNAWFGAELAAETMVADTRWLPGGLGEALVWPLMMTVDPARVGDKELGQLIWSVIYFLALAWAASTLWRSRRSVNVLPRLERFFLVFFAVAYVLWMSLFSIHRYLVPLEVLAPVVVWILCHRLFTPGLARRVAVAAVAICVAYNLVNWTTWGHRPWHEEAFRVEPPTLVAPQEATFVLADEAPLAWMVPYLPPEASYVSLGRFPESSAYRARARALMDRHNGNIWALVAGNHDRGAERIEGLNGFLARYEIAPEDRICRMLRHLAARTGSVDFAPTGGPCRFRRPEERRIDIGVENRAAVAAVAEGLADYGLKLDPDTCQEFEAFIGRAFEPYLVCRVR